MADPFGWDLCDHISLFIHPGQLDAVCDGRVLRLVARGEASQLESLARSLGAREVEIEPLSLEEILVACLRQRGEREVERV